MQDLSCQSAALAAHYDAVSGLLAQPGLDSSDKLRLLLLFSLRYEREGRPQARHQCGSCAEAVLWARCFPAVCIRVLDIARPSGPLP